MNKQKTIIAITLILFAGYFTLQALKMPLGDVMIQVTDPDGDIPDAECYILDYTQTQVDSSQVEKFPTGKHGCNLYVDEPGIHTVVARCLDDTSIREDKQITATSGSICKGDLGYSICQDNGITIDCPGDDEDDGGDEDEGCNYFNCDINSGDVGSPYCSEGNVLQRKIEYDCVGSGVDEACSATTKTNIDYCSGDEECTDGECVSTGIETTTTSSSTTTTLGDGLPISRNTIFILSFIVLVAGTGVISYLAQKNT